MEYKTHHYHGPNLWRKTIIATFFWGWNFCSFWYVYGLAGENEAIPWQEIIWFAVISGSLLLLQLFLGRSLLKMDLTIIKDEVVNHSTSYCLFPFLMKRWQAPLSEYKGVVLNDDQLSLVLNHQSDESKNIELVLNESSTPLSAWKAGYNAFCGFETS